MRIGIDCSLLVPHAGGIIQYISRLVHALQQQGRDDYVFWHRPDQVSLLNEMFDARWRQSARALSSPPPDLLRGIDVYFCPSGLIAPWANGVATVVTLVDIQEAYYPSFFSLRERCSRLYHHRAVARRATRVVTLSEFSKHSIATFYRMPAAKIAVAHLAPAANTGAAMADDLPARLPARFVLYPANFWPHKNHAGLLQALALVRDRHDVRIPCVLTGARMPNGFDPAPEIERLRLGDQVTVLEYQPAAALEALYRRAALLVFPSLFEGFGLPLVEAMATGCPVATSERTSLGEVGGDAVAYFDAESPASIADVMTALWHDEPRRAELARRGRVRARDFSPAAMAAVHRDTFEQAKQAVAIAGPTPPDTLTTRCRELAIAAWQSLRTQARSVRRE